MLLPLATLLFALNPGPPHVRAIKASEAPVIDGQLDEAVWKTAEPSDTFTQGYPFDGRPPSEHTTMRVLYDEDALYLGFECEQLHSPVRLKLTRRDRDSESEWMSVQIDPRGEGKVAFAFSANVSGVLVDAVITQPTEWSLDWDENWEARSARTATGWSVEYRIPFRVLRFDTNQPVSSWGFQAVRYIAQNQEADLWAYIPRDVANPIAHFGRLDGLTGLKKGSALELRPFATAQGSRLQATDQTSGSGYHAGWSAGLDLKWHVAQDLTLDTAVTPDFAQVEADQVILNLTSYETFLPEKRPLFLEGTDVFAFPLQVFYSRRIGFAPTLPTLRLDNGGMATEKLVNVPAPATIYGAGKLVGRLGTNWTVGALSALTGRNDVAVESATGLRSNRLVAPTTEYNALRLRREWGSSGHVGLIATGSTTFEDGDDYPPIAATTPAQQLCPSGTMPLAGSRCFRDSYVAGADALWRSPSGDYVANGAFIEALIRGGPATVQADGTAIGSGAHAPGGWMRVAKEGGHLLASAAYTGAGRTLDYNDLGFMPRQNLHELKTSLGYRTLEPGRFTVETSSAFEVTERRSLSGLDLGQLYEVNSHLRLLNLWTAMVAADLGPARFDDREVGNGLALEHGGYVGAKLEVGTDPKRLVVADVLLTAQAIQRGAVGYIGQATLTLSPVPQFDISLVPQVTWSSGEERFAGAVPAVAGQTGTSSFYGKLDAGSVSATLRANYTFAPRLSLQAYAQGFLSAGHFTDLRSVPDPANLRVRLDDIAAAPLAVTRPTMNPDFEQAALNLNIVFRWEYRLGSTLFLVYSRSQVPQVTLMNTDAATLQPRALGTRSSADVILVKLSYWWAS